MKSTAYVRIEMNLGRGRHNEFPPILIVSNGTKLATIYMPLLFSYLLDLGLDKLFGGKLDAKSGSPQAERLAY